MIFVSFSLYQNNKSTVIEYDENFKRFLLLNEITQTTQTVLDKLTLHIIEDSQAFLLEYEESVDGLIHLQGKLEPLKQNSNHLIHLKNYDNMLSSFLAKSEQTVLDFRSGSVEHYHESLFETERISNYIHELTLLLINEELSDYQPFYEVMTEKQQTTNRMGLSILVVSLLISTMFAVWFSSGITKSITRLHVAADEISKGNLDGETIKVSCKDELWFLSNTFNEMRNNIRRLVDEIQENARLNQALKEMELRSLQNQINPHFLFNTLNAILKTSYIEKAERTGDLISSVSNLLRYNLGNLDKTMKLEEELTIVKEYFYIQKTRFGDRVSFEILDEGVDMTFPIPCLTLQPLIENAFVHGIEEMEEGALIALHFYNDGRHLVIEICDNGVGMDEETRKRLLADVEEMHALKKTGHSTGIGLKNVRKRLAIFYQTSNVMDLITSPGGGTIVRLTLPIDFQEGKK